MPETPKPSTPSKGGSFFTKNVGGAPMWTWAAGAGLLVGAFLWWRNHKSQQNSAATNSATAGTPTAATSEELMAAGLYQPPDITYNVPSPNIEQSVNEVTPPGTTITPPTPPVVTPPVVAPPVVAPPVTTTPTPPKIGNSTPAPAQPKYITVTPWPSQTSTLWGISQRVGIPLAKIEKLNPQIKNPNLIYAGQHVRYA